MVAVVADLSGCIGSSVDMRTATGHRERIELMYRELLAKELIDGGLQGSEKNAMDNVEKAYEAICHFVDTLVTIPRCTTTGAQVICDGSVGRPAFAICPYQLEYLIENRFSVPQISEIAGVSVSTIRRRMSSLNLSIRATYSSISDDDLDGLIAGVQQQFTNWGNRQMYGHLISLGIRVPFHRVRQSQRRVDPEGSMLRQLTNLRRRSYSVPGPQHLWHIDGNHKLIRLESMTLNFL